MPLIKSISGIRGTIGGRTADNLTPLDTVKFTSAYAGWLLKENRGKKKLKVVTVSYTHLTLPTTSRV